MITIQIKHLHTLIRPCAVQALLRARENIKKARERAEEVLEHLDTSRKVEARIMRGPRNDLDAFLKALERLEEAIKYLASHRQAFRIVHQILTLLFPPPLSQAKELHQSALGLLCGPHEFQGFHP